MPVTTSAVADPDTRQYAAATTGCGLLERSDLGRLALTGTEAAAYLDGQVTNAVDGLTPGAGVYAAFLTPKGRMLGDLRVLRTDQELLLVTERATLQALFDRIRGTLVGFDAELHKRTLETAHFALAGARAREVAQAETLPEREHASLEVELAGISALAVATDVGLDLICAADGCAALVAALAERGATPVDEEVFECLRIESGRPRWGAELDETVIPEEAGLNERAVDFEKGCYVGQETVARLHWKGKPNRHLRGLELAEAAPPGAELSSGERAVGRLSSVAQSPRVGAVGLALIRREVALGDPVEVAGAGQARTVELPFVERLAE